MPHPDGAGTPAAIHRPAEAGPAKRKLILRHGDQVFELGLFLATPAQWRRAAERDAGDWTPVKLAGLILGVRLTVR